MATTTMQASPVAAEDVSTTIANLTVTDSAATPASTALPTPLESFNLPHSSADNPIKTVLDGPMDTAKPKARPALTAEQQSSYDKFLSTVSSWKEIPDGLTKGAQQSPLTDAERMFMTKECLLRYLRADKWNLERATTRLRNTLSWRREYGVYTKLTADYVSIEYETGKQVPLGWDIEGRTCLYLLPSKQNTERSDRQIEGLVFMLERCLELLPPGQETLALLINFADTKSGQGASVAQGKQTLDILQNHYPERLGRALITNLPFMIKTFFTLISPFIDPNTKEKLKFNENVALHVPPEQLMKESGGLIEFQYDHSVFWPTLQKVCASKREAYRQRWEKAGKRIGESEFYLRGGEDVSEPKVVEDSEKLVQPEAALSSTVPAAA